MLKNEVSYETSGRKFDLIGYYYSLVFALHTKLV